MSTIPDLLRHPYYPEFVQRYANNLHRFAYEVCGLQLTYQQIMVTESVQEFGSRTTIASGHGCFGIGTPIMLSDGSIKPVEQVTITDTLMGDDGTMRKVLALYRGKENLYRFTYSDGSSHVFNESHILCLVATNSKGRRKIGGKITVTVREYLQWGKDRKRCYCIYRKPIQKFDRASTILPIEPYILGVWLGDGKSTDSSKHIPENYLYASFEDRQCLLAGLIDTDGNLSRHSFDFIQKNKLLAEQVVFLARSIGCHATIKAVEKVCKNNSKKGIYWRVTIGRNLDLIPTKIQRKQAGKLQKQRTSLHFSIQSVEFLGEGDYYGFELDGNHQFLGGDFTVLHNTGKTATYGVLALWHLVCFHHSITAVIAPKIEQVRKQVFKEIALSLNRMKKSDFAWVAEQIVLNAEDVHIKGAKQYWHILGKTAPKHEPENLAGLHGDYLLVIADEASGIDDAHFGVLTGSLTDRRNRMVLASQPTRNVGFFYDTHHRLSRDFGGPWQNLTLNSEESPLVSESFLLEKRLQYSREQYDIKVRGLFPNKSDGFLLGRSEVDSIFGYNPIEDRADWGYVVAVDVGGGDFRDDSVMTIAKVWGMGQFGENARRVYIDQIPVMQDNLDTVNFARKVTALSNQLDSPTLAVDFGGMGVAFIHNLQDLGVANIEKVKWGNSCFKKEYKDSFTNLRAQAIVSLARAIQEKRFGISKAVADRFGGRIINELTRIPYDYDNKARYQIMSKPDMKAQGIPSPDIADTFAFTFLESVHYVAAEKEINLVPTAKSKKITDALSNLDSFFNED